MDFTQATVTIVGIAPISQSRLHDEPKLDGESHDAYDARTWRSKLNTEIVNGKRSVVIPAFGLQTAITAAAKYSKRQIPGQGKATWTAKFKSAVSVLAPVSLAISPDDVKSLVLSLNADGVRGSGKRVTRRLPTIPPGWRTTFDVMILDPIITEDVFREMLGLAGLFIGLGQFRAEVGGTNGRFTVEEIVWRDAREKVANRKIARAA